MDKSRGETSKQKNREGGSDRPLKKARYLWQVKGKYHLKDNNRNDEERVETQNEKNRQHQEELMEEAQVIKSPQCNNNSEEFRDQNLMERLILSSDKIFEFPSHPPSIPEEIPITLVKPKPKNEDFYLRKWQARQIAKGFVDNTINRVLENWMVAPFDATDFVENCDNDGQIEDEGILMAIQSHGLQSAPHHSNLPCTPKFLNSSECSCSKQRTTLTKKPVPFHSRNATYENMEQDYYENLCVLKNTEPIEPNRVPNLNQHSEDSKENDPTLQLGENIQDLVLPNNSYEDMIDDTDFLDAAVSAAIKKKGLSSNNCVDYG